MSEPRVPWETPVDPFAKVAEKKTVEVSPEQFDTINREFVKASATGHSIAAATAKACQAAGVEPPKPFTHVELVVNPLLAKDAVTGLWPGQQHPCDIPAFLKRSAG